MSAIARARQRRLGVIPKGPGIFRTVSEHRLQLPAPAALAPNKRGSLSSEAWEPDTAFSPATGALRAPSPSRRLLRPHGRFRLQEFSELDLPHNLLLHLSLLYYGDGFLADTPQTKPCPRRTVLPWRGRPRLERGRALLRTSLRLKWMLRRLCCSVQTAQPLSASAAGR